MNAGTLGPQAGVSGIMNAAMNNQGSPVVGVGMGGGDCKEGKKAVHVKWAGKTIALGTFPIAEADEKCARAKALTRAWRSTMRPKPNREWVMLELERLQVRVVSGRLGRRGSGGDDSDSEEDGDDDDDEKKKKKNSKKKDIAKVKKNDDDDDMEATAMQRANALAGNNGMGPGMGQLDMAELGKKKDKNPRRNSLVAMAEAAALSGMGGNEGGGDDSGQGGAGLLSGGPGSMSGMNNLGLSVNPNQHYEMLKLHHMNLLNEIQETTLMMNLYQQQQLQQQQQLGAQSLDNSSSNDQQLLQFAQQQQLAAGGGAGNPLFDSFYGMGAGGAGSMGAGQQFPALHPQASALKNQQAMGLGALNAGAPGGASNQMQALLRQQNLLQGAGMMGGDGSGLQGMNASNPQKNMLNGMGGDAGQNVSLEEQEEMCQARLLKLKQDIAERQRRAEVGMGGGGGNMMDKRGSVGDGGSNKRVKRDEE